MFPRVDVTAQESEATAGVPYVSTSYTVGAEALRGIVISPKCFSLVLQTKG